MAICDARNLIKNLSQSLYDVMILTLLYPTSNNDKIDVSSFSKTLKIVLQKREKSFIKVYAMVKFKLYENKNFARMKKFYFYQHENILFLQPESALSSTQQKYYLMTLKGVFLC